MKKIVIVDIDGTIANIDHRKKYVENVKAKDWDKFFGSLEDDEPILPIIDLIQSLAKHYVIVFCTGRNESLREQTQNFIWANCEQEIDRAKILMRSDGDRRPDHIIKLELLRKAGISQSDVAFVLEDRNSVVKAWRNAGFTCLQVAEGNF